MRTIPDLIQRARAGMALTPAERALLRLMEGLLCAGLVAAAPIIAQALSQQSVNWGDVARAALAAAATAALLALTKYARAHADPPLATPPDGAAGA
jgi:hypothetical protein